MFERNTIDEGKMRPDNTDKQQSAQNKISQKHVLLNFNEITIDSKKPETETEPDGD